MDEAIYDTPTLANPLFKGAKEGEIMASVEQQFEAAASHFAQIVEAASDKDKLTMYALVRPLGHLAHRNIFRRK